MTKSVERFAEKECLRISCCILARIRHVRVKDLKMKGYPYEKAIFTSSCYAGYYIYQLSSADTGFCGID